MSEMPPEHIRNDPHVVALMTRVAAERAERKRLMAEEDSFQFWDHLIRERPGQ